MSTWYLCILYHNNPAQFTDRLNKKTIQTYGSSDLVVLIDCIYSGVTRKENYGGVLFAVRLGLFVRPRKMLWC